ncbi:MAG TPA: alpha/beta hydrolase-fold protein [Verrucomicrobiae bacterium]|nr:alpha/beta hydrolase-fold protein [Verrucomicrobiae bacterium]
MLDLEVCLLLGLIATAAAWGQPQEVTHESLVMGGARTYRVFLPPSYKVAAKRFPVIYWFHGYEAQNEERDRALAAYVGSHDVILVDSGPADLTGNFPLYLPELIEHIDRTLRTVPDRAHRAVTGFGSAGLLALWEAARSPELVGSASSFAADRETEAGPSGFPVSLSIDDLSGALAAAKTWQFDPNVDIAATLDLHLKAFADVAPKPEVFAIADPYPDFAAWNWEVASTRRSPGFTVLENVSRAGFRSAVREWLPSGPPVASVKLSVTSARLYTPGAAIPVTYVHTADGKVRHVVQKADSQGRLTFDLDGDDYEIGVGAGAVLAASGYTVQDAAWATAGKPVKLKVTFLNKGAAKSVAEPLKWESPTPGLKFENPPARLFGLAPGESMALPLTFTVADPARSRARIVAITAGGRTAIDVPLFPAAEAGAEFEIADGRPVESYRHELGEGNRDGHASPGETFAILLREGGALHAAEVFTNDACIENAIRVVENGRRYSLPKIRASCEPGHVVHLLAHAGSRYAAIDFPVWYRP